jgi:hypothetical protein
MATRTPTYGPHLRIQASGVLGPVGGAWEVFSYGISMADAEGYEDDEEYLSGLVDDLVAFHRRQASLIHVQARLTTVKVAAVLPDGKWQGGQPLYERNGNWPGGEGDVGTQNLPNAPQVAMAVTLRTDSNTPRTRGRFYLPLPAVSTSGFSGLVDQAAASSVAGSAAQLVADLNNQGGIDTNGTRVVVASTFGPRTPVTSVSVGRVLDTIRSRRNASAESYVQASIP